jgi:L-alanine-DL-glutamate epimerase-like enolase superfamily enzyme
LVEQPIVAEDGYVTIPDTPGLGVQMDEKAMARYLLG